MIENSINSDDYDIIIIIIILDHVFLSSKKITTDNSL